MVWKKQTYYYQRDRSYVVVWNNETVGEIVNWGFRYLEPYLEAKV